MLGKVNFPIQEVDQLTIVVCHHKLTYTQYMYHIIDPIQESGDGRFSWLNAHPSYSCVVASPKKEAKFKGLKSYIAYQLTPSVSIWYSHSDSLIVFFFQFNNIQVSRRYKHFDWLYEQLQKKFNFVPIPPLPDKQIQGELDSLFVVSVLVSLLLTKCFLPLPWCTPLSRHVSFPRR